MGKFQFRLETVLRLREADQDEKQRALAEAYLAQDELARMRLELERQVDEVRNQYKRESKPGVMNVDHLLGAHRYELGLLAQVNALLGKEEMLAKEVARRQEALAESNREVRVLEKLRELHRTRHLQEERRQENKWMDEIAANMPRETD